MRKITGMGETIMDILFRNGQPVAAVPGGSCFNSVISIGRTGLPCRFIGYTGNDRVGRDTQAFLQANGVAVDDFEIRDDEKSAISLAYLDEHGDATYQFYKNTPRAHRNWTVPEFCQDDVLLFGSYYAICEGMRPQVLPTLTAADQAGAILYYDLNFRRSHAHELEALLPAIHENFRKSTIVRGSADDFEVMYGCRDARTIYNRHIAAYCPIFICTAGAATITVCTPGECYDFEAPRVDNVVSTVGAGDNFNAGFIVALFRSGIGRSQLPSLNGPQWQRLIRMASAFAGQACQSTDNFISQQFARESLTLDF